MRFERLRNSCRGFYYFSVRSFIFLRTPNYISPYAKLYFSVRRIIFLRTPNYIPVEYKIFHAGDWHKKQASLTTNKKETLKVDVQPFSVSFVRLIGLEPTRRKTPDPKSGASTNFATSARRNARRADFNITLLKNAAAKVLKKMKN